MGWHFMCVFLQNLKNEKGMLQSTGQVEGGSYPNEGSILLLVT
jgi:hypothetical protein